MASTAASVSALLRGLAQVAERHGRQPRRNGCGSAAESRGPGQAQMRPLSRVGSWVEDLEARSSRARSGLVTRQGPSSRTSVSGRSASCVTTVGSSARNRGDRKVDADRVQFAEIVHNRGRVVRDHATAHAPDGPAHPLNVGRSRQSGSWNSPRSIRSQFPLSTCYFCL